MPWEKMIRLTAFLVCLMLSAGCGAPAAIAGPGTPATSAGSSVNGPYKMSDIANMTARGVLPIVEKPVKMTLGLTTMPNVTDYEDNYLTRYLEKNTGIDLVFQFYPNAATEAVSRLDLSIAAGNALPDLLYVFFGLDRSKIQKYGQSGHFADLTAYFDKYAYFYKQALQVVEDKAMLSYLENVITSDDGRKYSFPSTDFYVTNAWRGEYQLNKVWLEKLGLQFPRTTDELYHALKAFKTQDPNGNGKADEIPMIWSQRESFSGGSRNFLNAFEYMSSTGLIVASDGSIQMSASTEKYREGLRYLHKLMAENLISPMSYTITRAEIKTMIDLAAGETAYIGGFADSMVVAFSEANSVRKYDYEAFDTLLAGPDGTAWATFYPYSFAQSNFVSGKSDIKEIAFRFLDYLYDLDTAIITRWGIEGTHWEKVDPAKVKPRFNNGLQAYYWVTLNFWGSPQKFNWQKTIALTPVMSWSVALKPWTDPEKPTVPEWQIAAGTGRTVPVMMAPGSTPARIVYPLVYTSAESEQIAGTLTTLSTYIAECEAKFVLGEKNLDSDWDTYLNELHVIGLEKYLKVATAANNRMNR